MSNRPSQAGSTLLPPLPEDKKRFMEHMRAVHFTLVTTCLLLFLGGALTPSTLLMNAYRQAREIRAEYCGIDNLIMSKIPNTYLPAQVYGKVLRNFPLFTDGTTNYRLSFGWVLPVSTTDTTTFDLGPGQRSDLYHLDRNRTIGRISTRDPIDEDPPSPLDTLPNPEAGCDSTGANATLVEFARRWDALANMSRLTWIDRWDSTGASFVVDERVRGTRYWIVPPSAATSAVEVGNDVDGVKLETRGDTTWFLVVKLKRTRGPGDQTRAVLPIRSIRLRLSVMPADTDYQRGFTSPRRLSWRTGSFEQSFPELHDFYADIGSLNLRALEKHLRLVRGRERLGITLFGAEVPADSLRICGMLVIVLIQFYLSFLFERFRSTWGSFLEPRFAWIGSNEHLLVRVLFVVSLSIPPLVTDAYLIESAIRYRLGWLQVWVLFALACVSITLAVRTVLRLPPWSWEVGVKDDTGIPRQ